jgi:hypothetical protein
MADIIIKAGASRPSKCYWKHCETYFGSECPACKYYSLAEKDEEAERLSRKFRGMGLLKYLLDNNLIYAENILRLHKDAYAPEFRRNARGVDVLRVSHREIHRYISTACMVLGFVNYDGSPTLSAKNIKCLFSSESTNDDVVKVINSLDIVERPVLIREEFFTHSYETAKKICEQMEKGNFEEINKITHYSGYTASLCLGTFKKLLVQNPENLELLELAKKVYSHHKTHPEWCRDYSLITMSSRNPWPVREVVPEQPVESQEGMKVPLAQIKAQAALARAQRFVKLPATDVCKD